MVAVLSSTGRASTQWITPRQVSLPGARRRHSDFLSAPRGQCTNEAVPPHISSTANARGFVGCVRHTTPELEGKARRWQGRTPPRNRAPNRPQQTEVACCFSIYCCVNCSTRFIFSASATAAAAACAAAATGAQNPVECCSCGNPGGPGRVWPDRARPLSPPATARVLASLSGAREGA